MCLLCVQAYETLNNIVTAVQETPGIVKWDGDTECTVVCGCVYMCPGTVCAVLRFCFATRVSRLGDVLHFGCE